MIPIKVLFVSVFLITAIYTTSSIEARIIHREKSLYSTVLINQKGSTLCLQFSIRRDQRNQSCLDLKRPNVFVLEYVRMMMAALATEANPRSILMIGMGGGTIPAAISELYPSALITIVEIDEAVVRMANKYFNFIPTTTMDVAVQDGRVFVKRAIEDQKKFEVILLDAFNGDYIPEHLLTQEFLQEVKQALSKNGIVIANTFTGSRLNEHESATYNSVFPNFINIKSNASGNRIIVAKNSSNKIHLDFNKIPLTTDQWLKKRGVNVRNYIKTIEYEPFWNKEARILTDQYSPANLLIH